MILSGAPVLPGIPVQDPFNLIKSPIFTMPPVNPLVFAIPVVCTLLIKTSVAATEPELKIGTVGPMFVGAASRK